MSSTIAVRIATCLGITTVLGCGGACGRVPVAPSVSSERSDYTPSMRLSVSPKTVRARRDSIIVQIDGGQLSAPGMQAPNVSAEMSNLYLTALLATPQVVGNASTAPWIAIAESDSIHVADSLRLGQTRSLSPMRFALPRPNTLDASRAFLVFRITGKTATRLDATHRNLQSRKVRVYACADWTLDGFVDAQREKALTDAYTSVC
jgi:hypothetical protein